MKSFGLLFILLFALQTTSFSQNITVNPVRGKMVCTVNVKSLENNRFALGIPETIGSSEGSILNFPGVVIQWEGPDRDGACSCSYTSDRKVEYSVKMIPFEDYVDVRMSITNLSQENWTNVFSFNCLNPVAADQFRDWDLERTYLSKNGEPFRMDGTTRINEGNMKTVQFYLNEDYEDVSPFVEGFKATSPDKTDDSYIVTMSEDESSYMAATSPKSCFLFDNLDRCCIHSATNFGDIRQGEIKTVTSRFYFAKGNLDDFVTRFQLDNENTGEPVVAMCYGNPWKLTDTTQWQKVYNNLDILKIYIGNIDTRIDPDTARSFIASLLKEDIKIAVELGGLLGWHAKHGDKASDSSFQQDYRNVKPLIDLIKSIDPEESVNMLDMDGPIRRMLFPKDNIREDYHTIETAVDELFEVVQMWRDSVPGIEINLLTNFPNWAWGDTPSYVRLSGSSDGYGQYQDVLAAVKAKSEETGIKLDGITIDNPYNYATGSANSNQNELIKDVDWMQRIAELVEETRNMGLKANMIFNTNSGGDAMGYSKQTLDFIELYHQEIGIPDGYWIQSWYDLPGSWLPETEAFTMTNLTLEAMKKAGKDVETPDFEFPEDVDLISPANESNIEGTTVDFKWHSSKPDIEKYWLQIAIGRNVFFTDSTLTDTTFTYNKFQLDVQYSWRVRAKNNYGWGSWPDMWVFTTRRSVGVPDKEEKSEALIIFPNPANGYIQIMGEFAAKAKFEIVDLKGNTLLKDDIEDSGRINISELPIGTYFIKIYTGDSEYSGKFVVRR